MAEQEQDARPDVVRVFVGEEKFSPFSYHSFSIGGWSFTTTIRAGESEEDAFKRGWDFLQKMKRERFKEARDAFYERLKASRPTEEDEAKMQ
jgi:hypothetical protein